MPVEITESNFTEEVENAESVVLADFWAPWCGPCKMLSPIIEELSEEQGDSVKVVKVNVDDNPNLAGQFGVVSIPTVIIFKSGEPVERVVGVRQKGDYEELIQEYTS